MKSIQTSSIIERIYLKIPKIIKKIIIPPINFIRLKQQDKLITPKVLILYVTNKCNSKCRHCFYWKELNQGKNLLTKENLTKLVKSLKHKLDLLVITGGEPSLKEDLFDLCQIFNKINKTKRIHIITNGQKTNKILELAKRLKKLNSRITFQVSIDGLEKSHNYIRGLPNSFENAIKTIKEINKLGMPLAINTTITKRNINELNELNEFTKKLNVTHKYNIARTNKDIFNIDDKILASFTMQDKENMHPNIKEMEKVKDFLMKRDNTISTKIETKKLEYMFSILNGEKPIKCLAGKRQGVVFPNGEVSVCEPVQAFANLKDYDFNFEKLWQSQKAKDIKGKIKNCRCIQSCNLLDSMAFDTKTLIEL